MEKLKTSDILDAIAEAWGHRGRWIFLRELRVGSGRANAQAIDGFLLDAYPSSGMYRTAFEVKTSRADFMKELRQPNKRREAMRYSNYFYFAAPKDMLKREDIPIGCGLLEVAWRDPSSETWPPATGVSWVWRSHRYSVEIIVPAPHRDVPGPTWTLLAAALRCQMKGRVAELGGNESIGPTSQLAAAEAEAK